MWKRRQAILKWEWDLLDNDDVEEIRPDFEASVSSRRYDVRNLEMSIRFPLKSRPSERFHRP